MLLDLENRQVKPFLTNGGQAYYRIHASLGHENLTHLI